jgi:tetratricopeptide (TPR) repeat protein
MPAAGSDGHAPVTFSEDIAPIVFAKCSVCHHPGGSAPFSVLSYSSLRPFATQIAATTKRRYMPPWRATADVGGGFVGQTPLTDAEIDLIGRWVQEGAAEGDPHALPPVPRWSEGWQLGTPDLVVSTPTYTLPGEGTDVFRVFVIPLPVATLKYVRGLEFRPGNPRVVHHANIRIDATSASRQFDEADPAPGYEGLIAHSAVYPDGHFLGWTPGQVAPLLPKGMAWRLSPGTDLVVEMHMQPSGKTEDVGASIGLYFGSDPPERTPAMLRLGRQSIDIPAGESRYHITDSFVLPVDVEVQAIQPHAHYRAHDVSGTATLPDGTTRRLIQIDDWDFRWQHVYRYVTPFSLPKGTTLTMRYTYDNSADNPRNPVVPPRRVFWGQRSSDEMGDLWIQVLTRDDHDLDVLDTAFAPKVMAEDVIGYERWIQSEPQSLALHDDVALLYLRLNRPNDAVRHFAISTAFQPESAPAHFNLGTALTMAGQLPAAVTEYERALAIRPDYGPAHNNLGSILLRTGKIADAIPHLREAVRIDPGNAQAYYNLGVATQQQGQAADAIASYRRALQLSPDLAPALVDLAWLLAAAPDRSLHDPALAVRLAQRAVSVAGSQDPAAFDALAGAYAASGDFPRALSAADAALGLHPPNAVAIGARRALYAQQQAYRLPEQ